MKKGALLISVVSLIGFTILALCLVSTLLIHVSPGKPTSPETAHDIVCTLHIFKTIATKTQTRMWIKMRRLVKAFAVSKLKYGHIQRPTPNCRPQDPPACAYLGDPCTYATSMVTHVRVNAFLFLNVAMQYC